VLVNIGLGTASILGVQLFALFFNGLMRDAAADVQADTQAHQRLISRDRVAQALRVEYQRRYAQLVDDVVPLLRTLSSNGVVDDDLRRRASAECRRLRALFDQAATFDHPLMRRLRPVIDAAEERHVDLVVDVAGDLPELADDEIDAVVRPLAGILDAAATSARIVLTSTAEEMTVSIVCDGPYAVTTVSEKMNTGGGDQIEIVPSDDMVWCLIRHELRPDAEEHALAR
jgi:hypothetical protein